MNMNQNWRFTETQKDSRILYATNHGLSDYPHMSLGCFGGGPGCRPITDGARPIILSQRSARKVVHLSDGNILYSQRGKHEPSIKLGCFGGGPGCKSISDGTRKILLPQLGR